MKIKAFKEKQIWPSNTRLLCMFRMKHNVSKERNTFYVWGILDEDTGKIKDIKFKILKDNGSGVYVKLGVNPLYEISIFDNAFPQTAHQESIQVKVSEYGTGAAIVITHTDTSDFYFRTHVVILAAQYITFYGNYYNMDEDIKYTGIYSYDPLIDNIYNYNRLIECVNVNTGSLFILYTLRDSYNYVHLFARELNYMSVFNNNYYLNIQLSINNQGIIEGFIGLNSLHYYFGIYQENANPAIYRITFRINLPPVGPELVEIISEITCPIDSIKQPYKGQYHSVNNNHYLLLPNKYYLKNRVSNIWNEYPINKYLGAKFATNKIYPLFFIADYKIFSLISLYEYYNNEYHYRSVNTGMYYTSHEMSEEFDTFDLYYDSVLAYKSATNETTEFQLSIIDYDNTTINVYKKIFKADTAFVEEEHELPPAIEIYNDDEDLVFWGYTEDGWDYKAGKYQSDYVSFINNDLMKKIDKNYEDATISDIIEDVINTYADFMILGTIEPTTNTYNLKETRTIREFLQWAAYVERKIVSFTPDGVISFITAILNEDDEPFEIEMQDPNKSYKISKITPTKFYVIGGLKEGQRLYASQINDQNGLSFVMYHTNITDQTELNNILAKMVAMKSQTTFKMDFINYSDLKVYPLGTIFKFIDEQDPDVNGRECIITAVDHNPAIPAITSYVVYNSINYPQQQDQDQQRITIIEQDMENIEGSINGVRDELDGVKEEVRDELDGVKEEVRDELDGFETKIENMFGGHIIILKNNATETDLDNALATLNAGNGGTIFLPSSTINITTTKNINKSMKIIGTYGSILYINNGNTIMNILATSYLEGFKIIRQAGYGGNFININGLNANKSILKDLHLVQGSAQTNVGISVLNVYFVSIQNCRLEKFSYGMELSTNAYYTSITGSIMDQCNYAIVCRANLYTFVSQCTATNSKYTGLFYIEGSFGTWTNNLAINSSSTNIYIMTISGNNNMVANNSRNNVLGISNSGSNNLLSNNR